MSLDNQEVDDNCTGLQLFTIELPSGITLAEGLEDSDAIYEDYSQATSFNCSLEGGLYLAVNNVTEDPLVDLKLAEKFSLSDCRQLSETATSVSDVLLDIGTDITKADSTIAADTEQHVENIDTTNSYVALEAIDAGEHQNTTDIEAYCSIFVDDSGNEYILAENDEYEDTYEGISIVDDSTCTPNVSINEIPQNDSKLSNKTKRKVKPMHPNSLIRPEFDDVVYNSDGTGDDIDTIGQVVQAMKCKECPFLTVDKADLFIHHQQCHNDLSVCISSDSEDVITIKTEVKIEETQEEENVKYMCAECSAPLPTIQACRQHMINVHNFRATYPPLTQDTDLTNIRGKNSPNEVLTDDDDVNPGDKLPEMLPEVLEYWLLPKTFREVKIRLCSERTIKCLMTRCLHRFKSVEAMKLHHSCHSEGTTVPPTSYQRSPQRAPPPPFTCSICNTTFNSWPLCSLHLWRAHTSDVDLMCCPICRSVRTHSVAKMVHHLSRHSRNLREDYKNCNRCDAGNSSNDSDVETEISPTVPTFSNKPPRWYSQRRCEICKKIYANSKSLKKHIQAVHNKLKPFKCTVCGHSAASKHMLQLHTRQHTGEKPFGCSFCAYRTGDHNTMRKHLMKHTGERPYRCPHCPYAAIQSGSIRRHLQISHSGQTLPVCLYHNSSVRKNVKPQKPNPTVKP